MPSLWLITPVHRRVELTRLCLEERAWLAASLAESGIDCQVVVIGDDESIETARALGFHVLERPNVLGRKVNDGIEYACRQGADFVSYFGSDDWALPVYFTTLPDDRHIRIGHWRAVVSPDGSRLVTWLMPSGITPWVIPRALLEPAGFRPAEDHRMNGVDGSIWRGIQGVKRGPQPRRFSHAERARLNDRGAVYQFVDVDELQRVGFKINDEITPYRRAIPRQPSRMRGDYPDPFTQLASRYPADLCERMRAFYGR
ncbi:MAG: hypothetical protein ACM33U_09130 [Solirubrobacterales bacterium]|nr:hypothetical protein [Solirubrobacterales bacterium]